MGHCRIGIVSWSKKTIQKRKNKSRSQKERTILEGLAEMEMKQLDWLFDQWTSHKVAGRMLMEAKTERMSQKDYLKRQVTEEETGKVDLFGKGWILKRLIKELTTK